MHDVLRLIFGDLRTQRIVNPDSGVLTVGCFEERRQPAQIVRPEYDVDMRKLPQKLAAISLGDITCVSSERGGSMGSYRC